MGRQSFTLYDKHEKILDIVQKRLRTPEATRSEILRYILDEYEKNDPVEFMKIIDSLKEMLSLLLRQMNHLSNSIQKKMDEALSLDKKSPEILLVHREMKNLTNLVRDLKLSQRAQPVYIAPEKEENTAKIPKPQSETVEEEWLTTLGL